MTGVIQGGNTSISEAAGAFSSVSAAGQDEALYTKAEVLKHFESVLESMELKEQIAALGHGMNSFFTRSRSLREFTAMSVALWKVAIERSFPGEAEDFFAEFMASSSLLGKGKKRRRMVELIEKYNTLLAPKKSDDFTPISQHMADSLADAGADRKALQLKLSLTIRKFYQYIFDHLI